MTSPLWDNLFRRNSEKDRLARLLKENILFQDLTKGELSFVQEIIHVRQYRPGEKVFRQNEVGVGMYIILRGRVDIVVQNRALDGSSKEVESHVTRLKAGDFFGELSLVEDHGRRGASAVAHEETQLIGFFKPDLMEILERNPQIGAKVVFRLAEVLGRRLLRTSETVIDLRREIELTKLSESKESSRVSR